MHRFARLLLIVLAAATAGCGRSGAEHHHSPGSGRLQLFLLAGQSNMAGRGVLEPQDRAAHARVWMLDRNHQWVPAADPMHFDKPIAGVGPGRSFGIALAEADPSARIGLIPAAVGGSSITAWEPGAVHPETGAHPYDDALARARIAQRNGELKAILWHQGESDGNERLAPEYERRLDALVQRFRRDLGNPDLPVLVGQIGHFPEKPWNRWQTEVDRVHQSLPNRLPHAAYVSAEGLEHKGDTLHFSAAASRELGRRYAAAYLRLRGSGAKR